MFPRLFGRNICFSLLIHCRQGFNYQQGHSLVNVKLKWVKDPILDTVVSREKDLKAVNFLISIISHAPNSCLPIYHLSRCRGQLGLPEDLKISTFIRRYPNIFSEYYALDSGGTRVPWFELTSRAIRLHEEELAIFYSYHLDILSRLQKFLMLTRDRVLPLQTLDQLKWDLGLPYNYEESLIRKSLDIFSLICLPDNRTGVKLLVWDENLAVSQLQRNIASQAKNDDPYVRNRIICFPIGFPRGFGLKRKCMEWLEEWQMLPYTSPYSDGSHLDPRTDESEKRIVGVFHELLHLTVGKKTERKNVSNLRRPLSLPHKFTKVFERHPGIFYISKKSDTQTVILREAYDRYNLVHKHPLVEFREKLASVMREGFLDRSRGLYKKEKAWGTDPGEEIDSARNSSRDESDSEDLLSEYDSEEGHQEPC
ncbi:hypothetical protein SAY87_020000 [Trapa incisa]|uniref:PORR domain-containing protein n=1 Tax=Trapa incisa TaxID=236973 RepID=A0AAN7K5B4_9MYRT|nr:hypothetical protein SAY87_020000 [Trapa incisa]